MRIAFQTLGCKLNFAETSGIANTFRDAGHTVVTRKEPADVVVINTCAVTDIAERKCRAAIRQARRQHRDAIVVVIGCFSQLSPDEIAGMDEVNIVIGNEHKFNLLSILDQYRSQGETLVDNTNIMKARDFIPSYSYLDRTRSFLKIQDGCNYGCTYCTIPQARGRSRSSRIDHIIHQVRELEQRGIMEIVLTGVNIGDFGRPHGESLLLLLQTIVQMHTSLRIRIGSVEPELLSDDIIRIVSEGPMLMPHFHIPLQSGSDRVLKAMKRRYSTSLFRNRVESIRRLIPEAYIACDIICGFPGESDAEYEESFQFIDSLPISAMHVFTYSERKNTPAQLLGSLLSPAVVRKRSRNLHALSERKKETFSMDFIGDVRDVLFESDRHHDMIEGFTDNYLRIRHPWNPELINHVLPVKLGVPDKKGIFDAVLHETAGLTNDNPFR